MTEREERRMVTGRKKEDKSEKAGLAANWFSFMSPDTDITRGLDIAFLADESSPSPPFPSTHPHPIPCGLLGPGCGSWPKHALPVLGSILFLLRGMVSLLLVGWHESALQQRRKEEKKLTSLPPTDSPTIATVHTINRTFLLE